MIYILNLRHVCTQQVKKHPLLHRREGKALAGDSAGQSQNRSQILQRLDGGLRKQTKRQNHSEGSQSHIRLRIRTPNRRDQPA